MAWGALVGALTIALASQMTERRDLASTAMGAGPTAAVPAPAPPESDAAPATGATSAASEPVAAPAPAVARPASPAPEPASEPAPEPASEPVAAAPLAAPPVAVPVATPEPEPDRAPAAAASGTAEAAPEPAPPAAEPAPVVLPQPAPVAPPAEVAQPVAPAAPAETAVPAPLDAARAPAARAPAPEAPSAPPAALAAEVAAPAPPAVPETAVALVPPAEARPAPAVGATAPAAPGADAPPAAESAALPPPAEPPLAEAPAAPDAPRPAAPEATGLPTPGFAGAQGVRVNRLPVIGGDAAAPVPETATEEAGAAPDPDAPALLRNAVPFENPDLRPVVALVLFHDRPLLPGVETGRDLPVPVSFAVDAGLVEAGTIAEAYRAAGREIVIVPTLPPGAAATDVEVALQVNMDVMPEAVALMDLPEGGFQSEREAVAQVVSAAARTGHGLVTFPRGLNMAQQTAERAGIPARPVFRMLEAGNPDAALRTLEQAAFRARQEGTVILVGAAEPMTVEAIRRWSEANPGSDVLFAPISAALAANE